MKPQTVFFLRSVILITVLVVSTIARAQAAPGSSGESEYTIGAEDILMVQVWGRPDLNGQVEVAQSGLIQLPVIGEVEVEGLTVREIGERLTDQYRLLDPGISEVLVRVVQYLSRSVTVVGEVRNPGKHGFREIPDLWEVLHTAGGETPLAEMAEVQIVRKNPEAGEKRTLTIDLSGGVDEVPAETLPQLRPKDTLIIRARSGVGVQGDQFQVLGAVRAPGTYDIRSAETVIEALALSGGPLENANLHKVLLTRPTPQGAVAYQLDIAGHLADAKPLSDLELKAGDTLTIPAGKGGFGMFMDGLIRLVPLASFALTLVLLTSN